MKRLKTKQLSSIVSNSSKIILLSFVLFYLFSCKKKEINATASIETQSKVIHLLNSKDAKGALSSINKALLDYPEDSDLLFFKASALAMDSGIDLLELYPVLQIKFFHESVFNWDDLKKYENPYNKFFDIGEVDIEININEKLKKKVNESFRGLNDGLESFNFKNVENYFLLFDILNQRILDNKFPLDSTSKDLILGYVRNFNKYRALFTQVETRFMMKLDSLQKGFNDYEAEYKARVSEEFNTSLTRFNEFNDSENLAEGEIRSAPLEIEDNEVAFRSENDNSIEDLMDEMIYLQGRAYQSSYAINKVLQSETKKSESSRSIIEDDESSSVDINLDFVRQNAMKVVWGVYVGLPLMSSLPVVEFNSFEKLDEALLILEKIRNKKDHLYIKSTSYMSFLSAASFLSILKKSLVVDKVVDPLSFVCNFNQENLFNSYHRIRNYINYFMDSSVDSKFSNKYFSQFSKFTKSIEDDQGSLSIESTNIIDDSVSYAKREVCDDY